MNFNRSLNRQTNNLPTDSMLFSKTGILKNQLVVSFLNIKIARLEKMKY